MLFLDWSSPIVIFFFFLELNTFPHNISSLCRKYFFSPPSRGVFVDSPFSNSVVTLKWKYHCVFCQRLHATGNAMFLVLSLSLLFFPTCRNPKFRLCTLFYSKLTPFRIILFLKFNCWLFLCVNVFSWSDNDLIFMCKMQLNCLSLQFKP